MQASDDQRLSPVSTLEVNEMKSPLSYSNKKTEAQDYLNYLQNPEIPHLLNKSEAEETSISNFGWSKLFDERSHNRFNAMKLAQESTMLPHKLGVISSPTQQSSSSSDETVASALQPYRKSTAHFSDIEQNKFYNIPNTNFSIAKSAALGIAAAAAAAAAVAAASSKSSKHDQTENASNSDTAKIEAEHLQTTKDPQAGLEFACNAFNAVQELLNVYGLSISPGDIVDAFKRQAGKLFNNILF